MSFAADCRKFAERAKGNRDLVVRKILLDIGTSLVLKSPVGDAVYWQSAPPPGYVGGRFRANWQFGESGIDYTTSEETDKTGATTIGKLLAAIPANASGKIYYLTNSLPYAERLENGWSRQAPHGMVGLTLLEFNDIVENAAGSVRP